MNCDIDYILGIETSCDETAAAVVKAQNNKIEVLSNVISSQIEIHRKYGGVVPEVAAREHVLNMIPVVDEALHLAEENDPDFRYSVKIQKNIVPETGSGSKRANGIRAIAVTSGPGLITSLLAGVQTAKALSLVWDIPLIGINHIEGHICANFIHNPESLNQPANTEDVFPAIVLTVSGGHTMLILMRSFNDYKAIGDTLDDAAGEAFDKAAALLGLGYPGGPAISAEAEKHMAEKELDRGDVKLDEQGRKSNIENRIFLPRPMLKTPDFNFSFSGLKTAIRYQVEKDRDYKKRIPEYAYEFQQAVIDVLVGKTIKAARKHKARTVMLAGGVSANKELRQQFQTAVETQLSEAKFHIPELKYTTDNAAMIAAAGYFRYQQKKFTPARKLKADCNMELK